MAFFTAKSDSGGTSSQFTKHKSITLSHAGALTDYQRMLIIAYESDMQPDFDDIRFNTLTGDYIPYWIESKTNSDTANVWIQYDGIDGDTIIKMYYGNAGLSSESDGGDVFNFFDDFEGAALSGNWTVVGTDTSNVSSSELIYDDFNNNNHNPIFYVNTGGFSQNYAIRSKMKVSQESACSFGFSDVTTDNDPRLTGNGAIIFIWHVSGANYLRAYSILNDVSEGGTDEGDADLDYNIYDIIRAGSTSIIYKQNNVTFETHTVKIPSVSTNILLSSHGISNTPDENYFDWIFVHKYTPNEPTINYGSEESALNLGALLMMLIR